MRKKITKVNRHPPRIKFSFLKLHEQLCEEYATSSLLDDVQFNLCARIPRNVLDSPLFNFVAFQPLKNLNGFWIRTREYQRLYESEKGFNPVYWGSDSEFARQRTYTSTRQNVILLCALFNGELK